MMRDPRTFLIVQTAFIGDVVLTLPLVQVLHEHHPNSEIDFVAIPGTVPVLQHHPAIRETIIFDKRGRDAGIGGILRVARSLRRRNYDAVLVPHRSLRSALLARLARIPMRIGFSRSTGRSLFTDVVRYENDKHEVDRNLKLLRPLEIYPPSLVLPTLYPGEEDLAVVSTVLAGGGWTQKTLIAVAPGSMWNTKRWLKESFVSLAGMVVARGWGVVLIGSEEDKGLCAEIQKAVGGKAVMNCAGTLTLLQSAEMIRRCGLLVSNDSAPMHLAVGVRTPVVAIFGPTVPRFGFWPLGPNDRIVERDGLACRPCSVHGGPKCPITTFDCMKLITPDLVFAHIRSVLAASTSIGDRARTTGENYPA